jgi:hypothetical protein
MSTRVIGANIAGISLNIGGDEMLKIGQDGLMKGSGWTEEEVLLSTAAKKPQGDPLKTVMVYWMDKKKTGKEPIGILVERRKIKRENDDVGMLRLARKTFARTEEEAQRIIIGDYV